MSWLLGMAIGLVVLVIATKFVIGRNRVRELDRDFSLELSCTRQRAIEVAASAARATDISVKSSSRIHPGETFTSPQLRDGGGV